MEELVLQATERTESPKKIRKAGFIPGVLHAHDGSSVSVQFEAASLNKIIARHGANARIWVESGTGKKFGYIKEIQKNPVEAKIIHVAIQLVARDQSVKMHLPVAFHGRDVLEQKMLQIQVYKSEVEVIGKAELMPDFIVADLSKKELGETVTASDLQLPAEIKNLDPEHEIYAIIKAHKELPAEELEEEKPAEPSQI